MSAKHINERKPRASDAKGRGRTDWRRLKATTDAPARRSVAADRDAVPLSDAALRRFARLGRPDVRAIRARLGLSQHAFARRFAVSLRTVQDWEQGRRDPVGPARVLLALIEHEPDAVTRALAAAAADHAA